MKKIISIILVAALLLGFIAMTVSVASADCVVCAGSCEADSGGHGQEEIGEAR